MICITLDRVGLTQSIVIQIIHRNVDLKCWFQLLKCLLLSLGFLTFVFHKVEQKRIYDTVGYIIITLLSAECDSEKSLKIGQ